MLQETYEARNAINEVNILQTPCNICKNKSDLHSCSFSVADIEQSILRDKHIGNKFPTLQTLIDKVLGKTMRETAAKRDLTLCHFQLAFQMQGKEGLVKLLSERDSFGKLRVTSSQKIIVKVLAYISII